MVRRKRVLVTAGPTREAVDAVRFLSNCSTGHMGYACAQVARKLGYATTLISGPTALCPPKGVRFIPIVSAADLRRALRKNFPRCDILIMSAAVSDYRPARVVRKKMQRGKRLVLHFVSTPDLLKELSKRKGKRVIVGFSLETSGLLKRARSKLKEKKLDFIVANRLSRSLNPFGGGKTTVLVVGSKPKVITWRGFTKRQIAQRLFRLIEREALADK